MVYPMEETISIHYGQQGLNALVKQLQAKDYSSLFVLTDTNTNLHCLAQFQSYTGLTHLQILTMRDGEEHKHLSTCELLWQELSERGADRNSALINLGGGVVTDLGGFVACTFKRGIDFYNVPTTLLSMVDASVGGKTGIDLGPLKNQIGIIQEPQMVVVDSRWLNTLPFEELRSGFSEMLKHGLTADVHYWNTLKSVADLTPESLSPYIERSVAIKSEVVLKDPKEKHWRKILNFGHTLGHAIESHFLTHPDKKRLLHGEAIAIGMITEAYLSIAYSGLSVREAEEIRSVFDRWFPKIVLTEADQKSILTLLRHDKKNKGDKIRFVLLERIGTPQIDLEIDQKAFDEAFSFYINT